MPHSGMAKMVRSVITRCDPCTDMPTPPPIDDAVDQRDIGLGELVHRVVEPVLVPEEGAGRAVARAMGVVERADVAAGAERALARARHHDGADRRVVGPFEQAGAEGDAHLSGERVEGGGRVELDPADAAVDGEGDVRRHRPSASRRRAMTTRMISLVPSRIW